MDLFYSFLSVGVGVAGLVLPGLVIARLCRIPMPVAAAVPLSSLMICLMIIFLQASGRPIRFNTVAIGLLSITAVCFVTEVRSAWVRSFGVVALWITGARTVQKQCKNMVTKSPRLLVGFLVILSAVFTLRVALEPLAGWDTPFRWDWLARCMLQHESLHFYPPQTAADFQIYSYPDGLPPLVAGVYWWLYASIGAAYPPITAVAVAGQFLSLLGLVYGGGQIIAGQRYGWVAAAVAASCPLLINGLAIGQETGFTAIAVTGQLVCSLAATKNTDGGRQAFGGGLFAALGCLARDYGPVLGVAGFAVLLTRKHRFRNLALFSLAAAPGLSWYVRNWWLTGNPVFSNPTPLDLPSNPVLAALLDHFQQSLALRHRPATDFVNLLGWLISDAGLVIVLGLLAMVYYGRRLIVT